MNKRSTLPNRLILLKRTKQILELRNAIKEMKNEVESLKKSRVDGGKN